MHCAQLTGVDGTDGTVDPDGTDGTVAGASNNICNGKHLPPRIVPTAKRIATSGAQSGAFVIHLRFPLYAPVPVRYVIYTHCVSYSGVSYSGGGGSSGTGRCKCSGRDNSNAARLLTASRRLGLQSGSSGTLRVRYNKMYIQGVSYRGGAYLAGHNYLADNFAYPAVDFRVERPRALFNDSLDAPETTRTSAVAAAKALRGEAHLPVTRRQGQCTEQVVNNRRTVFKAVLQALQGASVDLHTHRPPCEIRHMYTMYS